ncbi:hypothetical protein Pcinc_041637 [Petrolisthes cinctipes]|uniref:Uncharacterized protein n=1 Tax=Petrolisthes cinctipes TaxID=88211 RepID=A0AAE1BJ72_PETCI|nr:hypothetical protein Pcinc_041637 [Petrolisthes cinctipes]
MSECEKSCCSVTDLSNTLTHPHYTRYDHHQKTYNYTEVVNGLLDAQEINGVVMVEMRRTRMEELSEGVMGCEERRGRCGDEVWDRSACSVVMKTGRDGRRSGLIEGKRGEKG